MTETRTEYLCPLCFTVLPPPPEEVPPNFADRLIKWVLTTQAGLRCFLIGALLAVAAMVTFLVVVVRHVL